MTIDIRRNALCLLRPTGYGLQRTGNDLLVRHIDTLRTIVHKKKRGPEKGPCYETSYQYALKNQALPLAYRLNQAESQE